MFALSWLLDLVYVALLLAISPLLVFRAITQGKYRSGWNQKLWGLVPQRSAVRPCVWLHAVSVGEVIQLQSVLEGLIGRHPQYDYVISTTTVTGYEVARKRFPQHHVIYFPLDFSWAVRRALRRINPISVVLVELELWPNFILAASNRHIPVMLINGRISEHSFKGYRRIRPLMTALLRRLTVCAVQNEVYRDRLLQLGAAPAQVHVTGSIKFDRIETDRGNAKTRQLAQAFGLILPDRGARGAWRVAGTDAAAGGTKSRHPPRATRHPIVFIAGSTQAPEEQFAIESYLALREKHPSVRLLLVPRHRERFEEVAQLVQETYRLPLVRRSCPLAGAAPEESPCQPPVLLLDTLGELSACWGLADVAFVGGSLTNRGGQNMIEPAGYGAAVLFGPNTHNFRDVVDALLSHDAAMVVANAADLTQKLDAFLSNPELAAACGARAQKMVLLQRGATERTLNLLDAALPLSPRISFSRPAA